MLFDAGFRSFGYAAAWKFQKQGLSKESEAFFWGEIKDAILTTDYQEDRKLVMFHLLQKWNLDLITINFGV